MKHGYVLNLRAIADLTPRDSYAMGTFADLVLGIDVWDWVA
jgi:hypothetical protein